MRASEGLAYVVLIAMVTTGCDRQQSEPYTPGLGEIMTLQQMRHSKLWFAGKAGNWSLAAYELKELREGFADVIKFHPTHEGAPVPVAHLVHEIMDGPIYELDGVVAAHDEAGFANAFDALTEACNSCHEATDFGFNVVERPTRNPYTNQVFEPQ
jgi:hypothetical protein